VRPLLVAVLLAGPLVAEDAVELRRGGELRGEVKASNGEFVVLAMASGEIRLPRGEVARIRRDVQGDGGPVREILRDEWFFLLRDDVVAGWARVLHSECGGMVQVEERRVLFATREDRRRVEISTRAGAPREYLWVEAVPGRMELWSGQIEDGLHVRQHRLGGEIETSTAPWPEGALLPLCVWSAARLGRPAARGVLYDPRRGRTQPLVAHDAPVADWAGATLRTTAARVRLAQRVHAAPDAREAARDALLHPLTPRSPERRVHHLAGGFSITAPHERWVDEAEVRGEGKLLTLENRVTFARVEVETAPLRDATVSTHEALRRSRIRLAFAYDWFAPVGDPVERDGGVRQRVEIRRGKERWQGIVHVEKRPDRVFTLLALAPLPIWSAERKNLVSILDSFTAAE